MKIYDMKVNHLKNPLGFRMERTVFSWKVSEAAGKRQKEARVLVAADAQMKEILFDSGFDAGAESLCFQADVDLKPRTRYYWTVTVRSDAGEVESGDVQWFETAKRQEPWQAQWITCSSEEKRHPYFEKRIVPKKEVSKARLYLCGLGLYEAYYIPEKEGKSGEAVRIGQEYLTPYCNDYKEWVQYQTYDVTELLASEGKFSVLLGNGWYKGKYGFWAKEEQGFYGNEWKLIAELHITYSDGTQEITGTDESWTVRRSNITFSSIYDGERRDDTLKELPPEKALFCDPPEGKLTERMSLPVTVHEIFEPAELLVTPKGEQVFDLGQEFTGIFSLRVKEPAGTQIHIQTGEILQNGNFYNENLRSAKSEYYYISDGKEKELIPHFTFYGYRYVKIEGVTDLKKEDFRGLSLYSDLEEKGSLRTGNKLVNRLIENVRWGLQSNFLDVPTDCPQRDERMGWTGDAQVFSPTATYLKDTYAFYAKYLYDMAREQRALGGKVPDVVPSAGLESAACVWGDAACIIPWNLYLFYGDKSILEDQFESMRSWVDYVRRVDGDNHGWRYVFHYGDWLALDHPEGGAEQVQGATDEEFIANLYYAVSAGLVAKAAKVLGRTAQEEEYRKLSDEQFKVVKREYYSPTGRCCIKTQTALILTLKYHLSDNTELTKKQLEKLFKDSKDKLKTGFVGTPLLCNVLSDYGYDRLAYTLLLNEEYPGWLNEVKLGATTVWERWNSLLSDGTISGIGMNSMNHYAYGSVEEWMFRHGAGIQPDESVPGFKRVKFIPVLNLELGSMDGRYDSPSGLWRCAWELSDPSHVKLSVSVPFGCSAVLRIPLAGKEVYETENPMFARVEEGLCHLEPGDYTVEYQTEKAVAPVKGKPIDYAAAAIETMMRRFPKAEDLPPKGHFHYHQGVFLSGVYENYLLRGEERWFSYMKDWVDSVIDDQGRRLQYDELALDDIQPGILLFPLYERTKEEKYRKALELLMEEMRNYPTNEEGGFWHKAALPDEMWLDGLYMGGPVCAMYGARFGERQMADTVAFQALLMEKKTKDSKTGLMYHAYDSRKKAQWADQETGLAPEFWGRSIGWVPVAVLNDLDYLPADHEKRGELERMVKELLEALIPYQGADGRWYQVVNKPKEKGNWAENSCTCLYTAAICKAVRKGILDRKYLENAQRGYEGVLASLKWQRNNGEWDLLVGEVCIGTGVGDYQHYCDRPVSVNDLHGVGAFLLMCAEMGK